MFVTPEGSRGPCATPGSEAWQSSVGALGLSAKVRGERGEPSLPGSQCQGMLSHAHTPFQQGLQPVPSHYPWAGSQRQAGSVSQELLPPCRVPAAWLGLPALGTSSDLCRGGLAPSWCRVAVPQHVGVWLLEEMPAAFLPKPGSAGTRAQCGQLVPIPYPCTGSGVQSLFSDARELLGAGGKGGQGHLGPASPTSLPFLSHFSAEKGRAPGGWGVL